MLKSKLKFGYEPFMGKSLFSPRRSWGKLYIIFQKHANFFFQFYAQKKSEFCKQNKDMRN